MANTNPSALSWFEIHVRDLDRAQAFYEKLLAAPLRRETMGPHELAVFPYQEGQGVGGALVAGAYLPAPSADGSCVYLSAGPSLDDALARLAQAGGRLQSPKFELPGGMGVIAHIIDTEGNRVGLHALH